MTDPHPVRAIVDFKADADSAPVRLHFERPIRELRAEELGEVVPTLDEADRLARTGVWLVGFVSYDASPAFDPAFVSARDHRCPLVWFGAFDAPATAPSVSRSPMTPDDEPTDASWTMTTRAEETADDEYATAVERIRAHISAGDVYQVNLTVPFSAEPALDPLALYERMRRAQGGDYSAYVEVDGLRILSASPELFFERRGTTLRSRPMKGTAPRGLHRADDLAARDHLLASEKDRAENVMIVDVVRNDVGRVARTGSVKVTRLCETECYPRVWQLTSTVEGEIDEALPLGELFGALFPPASVTGAPKVRATRIIQELERAPRAVYCGAVGVVRPGGDATFNVAIRTAWSWNDGRTVRLNAGGGVTIDSTPTGELAELRTKLSAFTVPPLRPSLFETIRVERGGPVRLARHLARMASSAAYFDSPFDADAAEDAVMRAAGDAASTPVVRCRLVLSPRGEVDAQISPFDEERHDAPARSVAIAGEPVSRADVRLYHKTTDRILYDAALAGAQGMFDVVLWNDVGEATELTRGNLVAELDGARWTPPVSSGLLAGTFRAELLEAGTIRERVLTLNQLRQASRLWFINSLRGWVPIALPDEWATPVHSSRSSPSSAAPSAEPTASIAALMSSASYPRRARNA